MVQPSTNTNKRNTCEEYKLIQSITWHIDASNNIKIYNFKMKTEQDGTNLDKKIYTPEHDGHD